MVLGGATVCIWVLALYQLGIIGQSSILLDMLEMLAVQDEFDISEAESEQDNENSESNLKNDK